MRITARSAVAGVGVVVLAVVAQRVFVAAHRPLSWAVAAVVVAVLIDPAVDVLDRRIPRLAAVIVTLVVFAGAVFGVVYLAFDDLADGVDRFGVAAQDAAERLEDRDDNVGQLARDVDASRRVELFVEALEERTTGGDEVLASTAGTAPTYFLGGILTLFIMSYGPRIAQSAVDQLRSPRQRREVTTVVNRALTRGRRAILWTIAEALVVGVVAGGVASLLDVPAAAALGLLAGVFALLPHVGIVLGNLPLILLLLALRSDLAAIVATVLILGCQAVDSYVVRRRIARRSVNVGLLVPWVVALVGYAVYGVGGAGYGLAFAVFGLAALDEMASRSGSGSDAGASPLPDEAAEPAGEASEDPSSAAVGLPG